MASSIQNNLRLVLERVADAATRRAGTTRGVTVVAATKTQPEQRVREYLAACQALGVPAVCGENYAQELSTKAQVFPEIEWHFIGRLQRNKADIVVRYATLIESVGSVKLLDALEAAASRVNKKQRVLLQVNISRDPAKDGFLPEQLDSLRPLLPSYTHLQVRGLMTILKDGLAEPDARRCYREMAELGEWASRHGLYGSVTDGEPTLSMGMSGDFDIAVAEGANAVRIGSALFGPRNG